MRRILAAALMWSSLAGYAAGRWQMPDPCLPSVIIGLSHIVTPGGLPTGKTSFKLYCDIDQLPSALNACNFAVEQKMETRTGATNWFGAGYDCDDHQVNCTTESALTTVQLACAGHNFNHAGHRYTVRFYGTACANVDASTPVLDEATTVI